MRRIPGIFILIFCFQAVGLAQPLKTTADNRFLETPSGAPFFWTGDTGWELFHRLDREEALIYLDNRAEKGFNVIQAVGLYELQAFESPNAYGDYPLIGENILKPDTTPGADPRSASGIRLLGPCGVYYR